MVGSQPELIEFGNAVMSVIDLSMFATFAGYAIRSWRRGLSYPDIKPAFAIGTFVFGAMLTRFISLIWMYGHNRHISMDWLVDDNQFPLAVLSLAITIVGGLCVIRIFSPRSWSTTMWLGTLLVSLLVAGIVRVS